MRKRPVSRSFERKVSNFPEEVYNFAPNDKLTILMQTVLGDPGVKQLTKIQELARLTETLRITKYKDLDDFFGPFLGISRLPGELYDVDPYTDQLTTSQWRQIERNDAIYRDRIRLFLRAMAEGGTLRGIAMAAQAVFSQRVQILEHWRTTDSEGLSVTGRTNSPKEFLVVPLQRDLTDSEMRIGYNILDRIRPVNVIFTIQQTAVPALPTSPIRHSTSDSEYFEIVRYVIPNRDSVQREDSDYYWLVAGQETEAPRYAYGATMEAIWSLNGNVSSVESFVIAADTENPLPIRPDSQPVAHGPWRQIERADSPDNYPTGRYSNDPARYDGAGNYIFAWSSQQAYESWLRGRVESLGGEFGIDRYRYPIFVESKVAGGSSPLDALAPISTTISTLYYTR